MKVTLESTSKIVELRDGDMMLPARVWEGTTDSGIPCHAFITRIAVDRTEDASAFARELLEQRTPTVAYLDPLRPIDLRLIL
jgi:hypothetical protein